MYSVIATNAINAVKAKAIVRKFFGWVIAINCGLITLVGATQINEAADIVMIIFFGGLTALGILLIVKGNQKTALIRTFYDYSARLAADPEKSIDRLAFSVGAPAQEVIRNLEEMIALGFLPNTFIDTQRQRLVTPDMPLQTPAVPVQPGYVPQQPRHITIQCKSCGANNKIIVGTVGECEYCGSKISG